MLRFVLCSTSRCSRLTGALDWRAPDKVQRQWALRGIERMDNRRGFRHEGAADDFGSPNLRLRFGKSYDINLI
jgi:hypothetical protein